MNDRFLKALQGKNEGRPPVWIMRQAGRYLPDFLALRQRFSFLEMCHSPELAAFTTQLPVAQLGFDAAILFSDILVVPEALGVGLQFEKDKGPIIERPLQKDSDVWQLPEVDVGESLGFVFETIRLLKKQLKVPLIGFCGAPFTLASYMIEGGSSADLKKTKRWLLKEPASFHALLQKITTVTKEYLKMQVQAGVDAIQIFDSWAQHLAHDQFRECSLAYLKELVECVKDTPVILFCRGSSLFATQLAEARPAGISIDWNANMADVRKKIPSTITLQGNLDPDILLASDQVVVQEVKRLLDRMRGDPRYIFNLGHGIKPDTPVDHVKLLVDTVKNYA